MLDWIRYAVLVYYEYRLECLGWEKSDYPVNRGKYGYLHTVYSHPALSGVWGLKSALQQANKIVWVI
jgi:hypothetical protein